MVQAVLQVGGESADVPHLVGGPGVHDLVGDGDDVIGPSLGIARQVGGVAGHVWLRAGGGVGSGIVNRTHGARHHRGGGEERR
jgi:hypothetical protein